MKKLLANWHYGIKARVVDGALLVKLDTAVEPVLLRLDLSRVQANTLAVRAADGDYELGLSGYKMEFVPLARFETREAAEVAARCVERALFCGGQPGRFRRALTTTLGVMLGIIIMAIVAFGISGSMVTVPSAPMMSSNPMSSLQNLPIGPGGQIDPAALQAAVQAMQGGSGTGLGSMGGAAPQAPAETGEPGVPMSADDFLKQVGN